MEQEGLLPFLRKQVQDCCHVLRRIDFDDRATRVRNRPALSIRRRRCRDGERRRPDQPQKRCPPPTPRGSGTLHVPKPGEVGMGGWQWDHHTILQKGRLEAGATYDRYRSRLRPPSRFIPARGSCRSRSRKVNTQWGRRTAYCNPGGSLLTTTVGTSRSSRSTNATRPSGPNADGRSVAPAGKVPR